MLHTVMDETTPLKRLTTLSISLVANILMVAVEENTRPIAGRTRYDRIQNQGGN